MVINRRLSTCLAAALLVTASACSASPSVPTLVPTIQVETPAFPSAPTLTKTMVLTPSPAPSLSAGAYPYPASEQAAIQQASPMPGADQAGAYPGPAGAPARPNLSLIRASLVEIGPHPQDQSLTRLRVRVLESRPAEGGPSDADFLAGLLNQEVDLYVQGLAIPDMRPGDDFQAEVSFLGDEHGGRFLVSKFVEENQ